MSGAATVPAGRSLWLRQRFLVLRRLSQLAVLGLFLLGPWAGVWVVKGNLASSLTLGVLPLTDPFVLAFYGLVAGRAYCAWVCPVNIATDTAAWLRRRLRLGNGRVPPRALRHAVLVAVLLACALTGQVVWEAVNPVTLTQRALIFGGGLAWTAVAAVFAYDLLVAQRGWCGHVCPMGAAYALIGSKPLLRVQAARRQACDDCGDCYAVCPEPHVLVAPLKAKAGAGPLVASRDCTLCARCLDVCHADVFTLTHRFHPAPKDREAAP